MKKILFLLLTLVLFSLSYAEAKNEKKELIFKEPFALAGYFTVSGLSKVGALLCQERYENVEIDRASSDWKHFAKGYTKKAVYATGKTSLKTLNFTAKWTGVTVACLSLHLAFLRYIS